MSLAQRIIFYALFFGGSLFFLASGIRAGDALAVAGAVLFLAAEGWALVYLELVREQDKHNGLSRSSESGD